MTITRGEASREQVLEGLPLEGVVGRVRPPAVLLALEETVIQRWFSVLLQLRGYDVHQLVGSADLAACVVWLERPDTPSVDAVVAGVSSRALADLDAVETIAGCVEGVYLMSRNDTGALCGRVCELERVKVFVSPFDPADLLADLDRLTS